MGAVLCIIKRMLVFDETLLLLVVLVMAGVLLYAILALSFGLVSLKNLMRRSKIRG
jgi:hypothetical protein